MMGKLLNENVQKLLVAFILHVWNWQQVFESDAIQTVNNDD